MNVANKPFPRVPVSLRLPADITAYIEHYATEHSLKKTEAYETFLRRGLQEESNATLAKEIALINKKLDSMLLLLPDQKAQTDNLAPQRAEAIDAIARAARLFPAVRTATLFGSFARGTQRDSSDIDVRIELDRTMPFNLHDLAQFAKLIEQDTGREVDVVSADPIKNKGLRDAIEREGVVVYERKKQ